MLNVLKKAIVLILMTMSLTGCELVTSGEYCAVARPILPTNEEIDKAIEADLILLLRRIDVEDTKWEHFKCKGE
jgi:hypothetical protein